MTRLVVSIAFLFLIWAPIVQMVTGLPRPSLSVDENRKLAAPPKFGSSTPIHKYTVDLVQWFNDHFGFRDFLIRAKTQADYSVFGMSTRVHAGSDGWLFYRSVMDVEKPRIEGRLKKDADAVIAGTRQLANALSARGVKLIVMIAPMKDVYYSDFLPNTAKKLPDPRQVSLLSERMRAMPEIIFLDSESVLKVVAKSRKVFHKTDFHWNDPAAFEVSRSLVNQIGTLEGRTEPVWAHSLVIEEKKFSGGEAAFMPLFYPPKETGLFVKQNWTLPPYNYSEKKGQFEWIYEVKELNANLLSPIAVVGDSFFDGMSRSGIGLYFNKIYKTKWPDVTLQTLVGNLPSDCKYVFLEFIEVNDGAYSELMRGMTSK